MQRELTSTMFSYMGKSQYHETCIPSDQRPAKRRPANDLDKPMAVIDYTKLDAVTEDKLCRRAMEDERRAGQRWKENWGFLTNYNERGEYQEPQKLPEYQSVYSSSVPNTTGGMYGSRLKAPSVTTLTMMRLERALAAPVRKKKLSGEMVCY